MRVRRGGRAAAISRVRRPLVARRPLLQLACARSKDETASSAAKPSGVSESDVDERGSGTRATGDGGSSTPLWRSGVKQKLDPLDSVDEAMRRSSVLESEDEVEGVWLNSATPEDASQGVALPPSPEQAPVESTPAERTRSAVIAYQRPKRYRRRPGNGVVLAFRNFSVELKGLLVNVLERVAKPEEPYIPEAFGFTLSNEAILEFDKVHPPPGREPIPGFIQVAYDVLIYFVDRVYEGKAIERFWFLETVARMPYFAYTSCLHLYETLGWWRTGGLRLVHTAEEWNELHHLLIMEALGGNRRWQDRFLGQHAAIAYYWALVVFFIVSPKWSYKFSEMLETHAVSTYRQFIVENEDKLRALPPPLIAKKYYESDDQYMYHLDTALVRGPLQKPAPDRPPCETLFDVFNNILEDEWEHVKTMVMCQDYDVLESLSVTQTKFDHHVESCPRRDLWNAWAKDINLMDRMIELRKM